MAGLILKVFCLAGVHRWPGVASRTGVGGSQWAAPMPPKAERTTTCHPTPSGGLIFLAAGEPGMATAPPQRMAGTCTALPSRQAWPRAVPSATVAVSSSSGIPCRGGQSRENKRTEQSNADMPLRPQSDVRSLNFKP